MAVIKVGGVTEMEVKERKDRVDDALHATRAAVEEGIVPGGGVALLRAIKALENLKTENEDQKIGIGIVRKALQVPARQIVQNAGEDGSVVVGKILDNAKYVFGYNARPAFTDLVADGVIDPPRWSSLRGDAASIAGLLITTEAMVAELPLSGPRRCPVAAHGGNGAAWPVWISKARTSRQRRSPGVIAGAFLCRLASAHARAMLRSIAMEVAPAPVAFRRARGYAQPSRFVVAKPCRSRRAHRRIAEFIEEAGAAKRAWALIPEMWTSFTEQRLFRMLLPRVYGGEQVDPVTWFRAMEALANATPARHGASASSMAAPWRRVRCRRRWRVPCGASRGPS